MPIQSKSIQKIGFACLLLGTALLWLGFWGLWKDIGWIAQPFYAYAWWGYILICDGLSAFLRGQSLLTTRLRHLPLIILWSTTFWFFFELLNLRFQNWYYVGVFVAENPADLIWCGAFVVACFSTVFTGLFETYEVLTTLKLFQGWRGLPRRSPPWVSWAVQLLGAVMVILSLVFPYYLAPLVWGSLTFLVDPWNYRRGSRSILRDLEHGDFGLVARI